MFEQTRWSDDKLEQFYAEFKRHAEVESAAISKFLSAFPNDDPVTHRQYHEAVMRAAKAQEEFWKSLKFDIAKKGIWALLTIIAGLLAIGIASKIGLTLPRG